MFEQVESALNRQDYRTARNLIKTLMHNQPHNDLVHLYSAQLQEATEHFDSATKIYKWLMVESVNSKIVSDARTGIQRIQTILQTQRQIALDQSLRITGGNEPGLLILETVSAEEKPIMAKQLAIIMQLDAYTARLHLPSRGWRLYRLGSMGELNFYHQQLKQAQIPSFCAPLNSVQKRTVVSVKLIKEFNPQAIFNCVGEHGEKLRIGLEWSKVKQIVTGLLPIFEEITEVTNSTTHTNVRHKSKILDYVQVCDLHVPSKSLILRFCNQHYSFQQDVGDGLGSLTSRENWQHLLSQIHQKTSHAKLWSDFTPFAETALAYPEMLQRITAHVPLIRRNNSLWDQAFQMYSNLIFVKEELGNGFNYLN
jgi:hypothetical protein